MDTTKEYIEMCKAARKELQWSPINGDTIHIPLGIKYEVYDDYGEGVQEELKIIQYYDEGGNGTEWVYDSSWRVPDHTKEDAQASVKREVEVAPTK